MSSHKEIKDIILSFENKYPVAEWNVNGVDIWPNIRFKLYFHLLNYIDNEHATTELRDEQYHNSSNSSKILLRFKQVYLLIKYFKFIVVVKKINYLFLGLKMHRVLHEGKWINRFFDPIIEKHKNELKFLHFEIDRLTYPVKYPELSISLPDILNAHTVYEKLKIKFRKEDYLTREMNVFKLDAFCEEVVSKDWYSAHLRLDLDYWKKWTSKVDDKKRFFIKYFKKAQLSGIVMASYYGYENTAAAILAAKELNIPVADFQHGPQNNVHMAYAHWTSVPPMGFNTMPSHYWCWDDKSSATINDWNLGDKAKPLGNTWLQFMRSGKVEETKKYVMYSLQVVDANNIDYFFTESILELMRFTLMEWKIRIHPRSVYKKMEIERYLIEAKIPRKNFHLELSFDRVITASLAATKVHITNFSGCLIEAYQLGIPSLIVDEVGYDFYSNYLEPEKVVYKNKYDTDFKSFFRDFVSNSRCFDSSIESIIVNPSDLFFK